MMSPAGSCDECGREMRKAHRIYKGSRFCATCYARVFKRRICPKCGDLARLPINDEKAVCRRCDTAKPCARCGKTDYRVGRITQYGPVCNACAPHFREPEQCETCGRLSTRLTRASRLGHEMHLCPKCARMDHGTCAACRRHRPLSQAADGRMLCKACLEKGEIACPSCGKQMPGGRGKVCEECYWTATCRKRVRIDQAAFANPQMSAAFGDYGDWLIRTVGPHKAALLIHRHLPFFLEVERMWGDFTTYEDLLRHFGAEGLRRVRLPMRWLLKARGIRPDPEAREAESERMRIESIMSSIRRGCAAGKVLLTYRSELTKRIDGGKMAVKSARLALRAAASLLLAADSFGNRLPEQKDVERYLANSPGQRAALIGFLTFLRRNYGLELAATVDRTRQRSLRRRKLEREIIRLARCRDESKEWLLRWIVVCLEYFHGRKIGKNAIRLDMVRKEVNGLVLATEGTKSDYWIPTGKWNP